MQGLLSVPTVTHGVLICQLERASGCLKSLRDEEGTQEQGSGYVFLLNQRGNRSAEHETRMPRVGILGG